MNNNNTKVIFFGTPDFVIPVLNSLIENFEVVGVVTAPDQKVGRKQILTPSPVKLASQGDVLRGYSLKVFTPEKLDQDFAEKLRDLKPDLFVVAAYGKIIPKNILDIPKQGAINIHPSMLPKYRGPSPIQSAILAGDKTTGISVIKMDEKMDHGPIIYAEEFSISDLDNFQTLSTKMFDRSSLFLAKIIPAYLAGELELVEQDDTLVTFCKIIKKEDGYFDLKIFPKSPNFLEILDRMVRAYYPWPTTWTHWNNKIVKLMPDKMVQIEGKKPVKLEEFLRGYPDFPIKNLLL
ncbi:MAG: methionyl-tRNA formyltransferase [Microgenomates group bacterium]|jgi:methionyl-tRNA formyltransferase